MMEAIKLENVSFSYIQGDNIEIPAIKNVSLSIEEGSFVALVGHNGSGKSTLAKLLNGLFLPSEGVVKVFGVDTADDDQIFHIRSNVGMVFQNPDNQMIASVVEDDVAFGPENLGIPREEIRERVDWALERVGMSDYAKATPFKMSGGQKQRVAIAGILAIKPRVLVLDESTAMLDPEGRREVLAVAKELNEKEKMTVILITHYMDEAVNADRVLVMNDGEVVMDDKPINIFSQYQKLKDYQLDAPIVTEIAHSLRDSGLTVKSNIINDKELVEEVCQLLSKI